MTVRAEPPGSPLTAQTLKVMGPVLLLNASPADSAHHERLAPPFVSIEVYPSGDDRLSVESMRRALDVGESGRQAHGIQLLSGPVESTIGGRAFFRTGFSEGNATIWKTFFKTSVHGGVLVVSFCAGSKAELDRLLPTAETLAFDESH